MKYVIVLTFCFSTHGQGFANAFMNGYRDGETIRENERREQELENQRQQIEMMRRQREYEERARQDREQEREEVKKREDLKLKLEALKQGYEITDDGQLQRIKKSKPKKGED